MDRQKRVTMRAGEISRALALVAIGVLCAADVEAGLLDSPAPLVAGARTQVVYRMGPVYYLPGETDTIISCTSTDATTIGVAVELFDQDDAPVGSIARAELAPGGRVDFVTSTNATATNAVVIDNLAWVEFGKARVSATSGKISCSAMHRRRTAQGAQEAPLELVKRVRAPVSTAP